MDIVTHKRDLSLVHKAMRVFIISSILSKLMIRMTTTIDGMIVGQFLSPDALSAVALFIPFNIVLYALDDFFSYGVFALLSKYVGARDRDKEERTISAIVVSFIVLSLLLVVVAFIFSPFISTLMCDNEVIRVLFEDYLCVALSCGGLFLFYSFLTGLVSIEGNPQFCTKVAIVILVVNVSLDYLFVAVAGLGIAGSAFATGISTLMACIMLFSKLDYRLKQIILHPFKKFKWAFLRQNLKQGVSFGSYQLLSAIMYILLETTILKMQGPNGLFALAVILQLFSIIVSFADAIGSTISSLGALLIGQVDYQAFANVSRQCIVFLLLVVSAFVAIVELFPDFFTVCFGANTPELIEYAHQPIQISMWGVFSWALSVFLIYQYQTLGYFRLTIFDASVFPVLISLVLLNVWVSSDVVIWYVFLQAGVLLLLTLLVVTGIIKRKKRKCVFVTFVAQKIHVSNI